jgi:hypothetical protein
VLEAAEERRLRILIAAEARMGLVQAGAFGLFGPEMNREDISQRQWRTFNEFLFFHQAEEANVQRFDTRNVWASR